MVHYTIFTHSLPCDRRPLMKTNSSTAISISSSSSNSKAAGKAIANPYAKPLRCPVDQCLAQKHAAKPVPSSKRCPWHPCCVLTEKVVQCPRNHDQNAEALARGHRCSHKVEYHVYARDLSRFSTTAAAEVSDCSKWDGYVNGGASCEAVRPEDVPLETLAFINARSMFFNAGEALYKALVRYDFCRERDHGCCLTAASSSSSSSGTVQQQQHQQQQQQELPEARLDFMCA